MNIPEKTILAIAHDIKWQSQDCIDKVFESLKGKQKRDWFIDHAYHCLPLLIGNQYGFIVKSLYDFSVFWDGGPSPDSVKVDIHTAQDFNKDDTGLQSVASHFGMGTVTVQMPYQLRTPPGINLMTINPPNYFIDGLYHMTGVVETDNLRRDFTYNLRITRPNHKIQVKTGNYIGCFIPYPRHFIDNFQINGVIDGSALLDNEIIQSERQCMKDFAIERSTEDIYKSHTNGKRYWRGEDVYGNKFPDHQIGLDK